MKAVYIVGAVNGEFSMETDWNPELIEPKEQRKSHAGNQSREIRRSIYGTRPVIFIERIRFCFGPNTSRSSSSVSDE